VGETVDPEALDRWLRAFADAVRDAADELTALDSAIGDADHGANMRRGMTAVVGKLESASDAGPAALLKSAGMTLVSTVGGASGPLYGTLFLRMATAAGDRGELDAAGFAAALRAGLDGVVARGKAAPGDKTMLDALVPAVDALDAQLAEGNGLRDALRAAADAADAGSDATIPLVARKGRASYLGERSAGHRDPGAASTALLVRAAAETLG
jgi:phosphoenolpyruvate---glycerone phosphotransferase subunit DhaL